MDEIDFLRGIEGEKQQGEDLVSGAEHLVRLKIQAGQPTQTQYPDLELEKTAGAVQAVKDFTMGLGASTIKPVYHAAGVAAGTGDRAYHGGALAGTAALLGGAYLSGKQHGKKQEKKADLSESIGSAALCKKCGKEKCACMDMDKQAALADAAAKLKNIMQTNPHARAALIGGTVGAATGAFTGAAQATPGNRLHAAASHGAIGAVAGAGGNALMQHLNTKVAQPEWNNAMLATTTGIGALAGGVGTYLGSRPQKDTGKSKMEEELEGSVAANKTKPERGFLEKLKNRETESAHGIAKVFREHPNKAALMGLLTGAVSGYGLGQLGGAIARRRGGK